jgi:hypothetical protein
MSEPALARNVRGKGRHYEHPVTGDLVPSVTNVIGMLDKPALPRWAAKVVAEQAWTMRSSLSGLGRDEAVEILKQSPWRSSSRSAARGTSIHFYLECAMRGDDLPELEGQARDYQAAADSVLRWFDAHAIELVASEQTVFSHAYAGTYDAHLRWHYTDDAYEDWLVDYKTGTSGPYDEVSLQLSALAAARTRADGKAAWSNYDRLVAISVQPGGKFVMKQVADPEVSFEAFEALLAAWHWKNGDKPLADVEV